jgi:hypothetical protein
MNIGINREMTRNRKLMAANSKKQPLLTPQNALYQLYQLKGHRCLRFAVRTA